MYRIAQRLIDILTPDPKKGYGMSEETSKKKDFKIPQDDVELGSKHKLITVPKLSEYLHIKEKNIYAKVEAGEIPHYRIGRLIRFRLDEIEAWLETCRNQKGQVTEQSTSRKRKAPSRRSSDHISALITKAIDEEREKYYDSGYGKSDRIEDLGKEAHNGTI